MENERKRILNMVEKGTITATEALTLLEALEKQPNSTQSSSSAASSTSSSHTTSSHSTTGQTDSSLKDSYKERPKKKEFPFNLEDIFQTNSGRQTRNDSSSQSSDRIMDFVQNAFEKVKGMDLEFNMGPSLEFRHQFEVQENELQDIEISVANGKVEIKPWDENYVKAECDVKVYRSDDEAKAKNQIRESVIFNAQYKKLRFISDLKMIKLDTVIYVPRNSYDRWDIRLFNGKFHGDSANVNKIKVKTANGKIELANMLIERGELETANGGIEVKNTRADLIDAESVNGKVSIEGAVDEMDVQSLNGNIVCRTSSTSARKIEAKTLAGSISLFVPNDASLDGTLKSNFGRFDINHREMDHVEEREELMQRKLHFTREKNDGSKLYLFADAKTGAVSVKPYEVKKEETEPASEE
ncbi:DUF4097 family beta strand repeat-containing protein [Jeotgalibacillus sp. ET6]|uniref:DUF4097 family beta strand repeat-containing protein n=1 Tax=Jeotgalibacillus sp. ET6 TaxID=3037260 RepID=UPI00241873F5|nr:DUF4097 family beta strand repeat-containing protein [Jeotgalibacillus sp. ET6]MDG5471651.1 DUF4097 family beta strand repeat-containing protein [Jeotgalibacillus sp. ET6]